MFATNDFEHVRTKLGLKEQYGGKNATGEEELSHQLKKKTMLLFNLDQSSMLSNQILLRELYTKYYFYPTVHCNAECVLEF